MEKLKMHTLDKTKDNFEKLAALFPNAVTETIVEGEVVRAIDADVLQQEISAIVVEGADERYQFTWPDKKKSILLANSPIAAALRPCREESVDFDNTENLYIEGDNLDVLKLMLETYLGKVKMIYIDPPYNTGNDFIYNDDFIEDVGEFLNRDGQYDEEGNRLVKNLDSNGRFHTDWLNMIYPRLRLARDLLSDDGIIFISIDDNEVENLKKICNEVFGGGNFINQVTWVRTRSGKTVKRQLLTNSEYLLIYAKGLNYAWNPIFQPLSEATIKMYSKDDNDGRGKYRLYPMQKTSSPGPETTYDYIDNNGKVWKCPPKGWRMIQSKIKALENDGRLCLENEALSEKAYWNERTSEGRLADTLWSDLSENSVGVKEVQTLLGSAIFNNPKPTDYVIRMLEIATNSDDIVLDFFSGSATTAHAVMQLNAEDGGKRKFIMVQLPEKTDENSEAYKAGYKNICEIGKERIRRAGKKIKEENKDKEGIESLDIGFRVLKLDSSNMKDVYYTPDKYEPELFDKLTDNIKEDRTPEDLLFQVMLDLGVLLSSKIERREVSGKTVFSVADNYLLACFDSNIGDDVVIEIAKLKPYYAVFRDSSFASDSVAANFEQIFATYSPSTVRRVL
ncbi:MAG: site-specific DNA-methyltransferase [Desulfitobacteriia bacterium]|jgi:adenine-specific DNA-methyltransferase